MWFSYQGDNDLQRGTFVASGGGKLMQITQRLRVASTQSSGAGSIYDGSCEISQAGCILEDLQSSNEISLSVGWNGQFVFSTSCIFTSSGMHGHPLSITLHGGMTITLSRNLPKHGWS